MAGRAGAYTEQPELELVGSQAGRVRGGRPPSSPAGGVTPAEQPGRPQELCLRFAAP